MSDTNTTLETLRGYNAWRERLATEGPNLSVEAYVEHLRLRELDDALQRIESLAEDALDEDSEASLYKSLEGILSTTRLVSRPAHEPITERSPA